VLRITDRVIAREACPREQLGDLLRGGSAIVDCNAVGRLVVAALCAAPCRGVGRDQRPLRAAPCERQDGCPAEKPGSHGARRDAPA